MDINHIAKLVSAFGKATPISIKGQNNLIQHFLLESIKFFIATTEKNFFLGNKTIMCTSEFFDEKQFKQIAPSRKTRIINYILNQKYFSKININQDYRVTIIDEDSFTFLKDETSIKTPYTRSALIKSINVKNKCQILCDVFKRNETLYCLSIELLEVWYSKILNTTATSISSELLVFCFLDKFGSLIKELIDVPDDNAAYFIHGVYNIRVEVVEKRNVKNINYVLHSSQNKLVSKKIKPFDNSERHRYHYFIYPGVECNPLDDNFLIDLFSNKKFVSEPVQPPVPVVEPVPATKLNIEFCQGIINKDKIHSLLYDLISKNYRFEQMYRDSRVIFVFKDFIKDYTDQVYINFKFRKSKTFHAYLTRDLKEITSITFIETIRITE